MCALLKHENTDTKSGRYTNWNRQMATCRFDGVEGISKRCELLRQMVSFSILRIKDTLSGFSEKLRKAVKSAAK